MDKKQQREAALFSPSATRGRDHAQAAGEAKVLIMPYDFSYSSGAVARP